MRQALLVLDVEFWDPNLPLFWLRHMTTKRTVGVLDTFQRLYQGRQEVEDVR